jgi:hypothetical protein
MQKKNIAIIFYVIIIIIYGVALVLNNKPFLQYSPLHLISVVFFIYSGFMLVYAKKHSRIIMWGFFAFYLAFNLYKIPYMWVYGYSFYAILPLHICNLSAVFMIARPFYTKGKSPFAKKVARLFDNYLICFTFLGAFLNIFLPPAHGFGPEYGFFSLQTFESNIIHWSFFTVSIYYFVSGKIKPDRKMAIMNLVWIIPAYVVFIFLNSIFVHSFFYTSSYENPIIFLYNLFPMWEWTLGNITVEVNPIYWVIIISVSALVLFLVTSVFEVIDKKVLRKDKQT